MKLILSVEALTPMLSGIGRYTWELACRMPAAPSVEGVRFYANGRWVDDPATLLESPHGKTGTGRKRGIRWPRQLAGFAQRLDCRGQLFHGPNYFLPPRADVGVITVHDLSVFSYPETHPIERIRHFERDFALSLKRTSHVITDSLAIRDEFVERFGWPRDKVTAVPLGVAATYSPKHEPACRAVLAHYGLAYGGYVLCVSTLEPRKNITRLLEAWSALPATLRRRFKLVLAGGKGWLSEALRARIEVAEAQGWLRYLGYVLETHLPVLYAGARLFVFPLLTKASACRCWRPWRQVCRWCRPTAHACPKLRAGQLRWWTRTMSPACRWRCTGGWKTRAGMRKPGNKVCR